MILYPNAKINLALYVFNKRADGYHSIDSVFYPIPWCDVLEIVPSSKERFTHSGIPINPADNLVVKAYEKMKATFQLPPVHIHLHKQIPLGAGLGGGSSDAAFCLKGLNQLFDLQLSLDELADMALQLGSDCPFFIYNQPARVRGRGEKIEPIDSKLSAHFIKLIHPNIHISTQEAFSQITPSNKTLPTPPKLLDEKWLNEVGNDFEEMTLSQYPELKKIKQELKEEGAFYTAMTGSGSTIYGLFDKAPPSKPQEAGVRVFQLK
ncbi:MAG: 4-(cytidine 5'-diphospho)-2-C-methyl-D-erythritol kinase [Crocinitomicaceae bacterium]